MNQNDELRSIKLKIRALNQKSVENGCSEAEAYAAMAMVGKLLKQYHLTMEECDVRDQACKTWTFNTGLGMRHPLLAVVRPLANLFHARCWTSRSYAPKPGHFGRQKSFVFNFFGQEDDIEMIQYLMEVIWYAGKFELKKFQGSAQYRKTTNHRKSETVSFQYGMSLRLAQRLHEMKEIADKELFEARKTGTALMVLKGQLVEREFVNLGLKLQNIPGQMTVRSNEAFASGKAAGDRVNLSRPISSGDSIKGYLT